MHISTSPACAHFPRLNESLKAMSRISRLQRSLAAIALSLAATALPALAADSSAALTVTGPHTSSNLAIYLIHGPSRQGPVPLTLAEALRQNRVQVHETGQVQQLLIENTSSHEVFVQAGDIVKGGRQDRVLSVSLLLPPHSGKVPIGSYCVEQGRWSRRPGESVQVFASAEAAMPSKAAKLAILSAPSPRSTPSIGQLLAAPPVNMARPADHTQQRRNAFRQQRVAAMQRNLEPSKQQEVWRNVADIQRKLSTNLATAVRSAHSASSLQLSLEHQKLVAARQKMAAALLPHGTKSTDIVGFAFAINGKINSAEIYPSNGLFNKMWPKLIESSVTEAIAEKSEETGKPPAAKSVEVFLEKASSGKAETASIQGAELNRERRQTDKSLSMATRRGDGSMVHRSILAY